MDQKTEDPDVLNVLALERVDRTKNMARYYVLSVEPTLFAESSLVRRWAGSAAPSEHESTFMLPRRSRRWRSTRGWNASGVAVTDSPPNRRLAALCRDTPVDRAAFSTLVRNRRRPIATAK
jgi:hypothetical protein